MNLLNNLLLGSLSRHLFTFSRNTELSSNIKLCTMEEKVKLLMSKSKTHTSNLNKQGAELKHNLTYLKARLNLLQDKIDIYKRKENNSYMFRDLVKKYATAKLQLHHKQHTLSLLDEANDFGEYDSVYDQV